MESLWTELHHHTTNYDTNNDMPVVLDGPTWTRYWNQANRIFQAYRNVVELHPHAPHVFCLLDQLVLLKQQEPLLKPLMPEEEGQKEKEHDSASFSSFSAPPVRTSWSPTLLIHALRKWHILATDRTSSTTPSSPIWTANNHVPQQQQQQQQQQQHQQDEQPETILSPPLTDTPTMTMPLHQVSCPYTLLHKIQTYVQAGLFPPRSAYYGLLLNGMFPRYSPQELQDMMLQSMNHSPPTPTPIHDDNAAAASWKDEPMEEDHDHNHPNSVDASSSSSLWKALAPDGLAFYTVLQAWRQAKRPQECHALVQEYCRRVQQGQILVQAKDVRLFQTAIAAWAEQLSSSSSLAFKNHRATFSPQPNFQGTDGKENSTTTIRTQESDIQAAERAMELYQLLQDTARYASFDMVADTPLMHTLIQMWYRVQRPDQVEDLFQAMQTNNNNNNNKSRSDAMGGGCGPPTWETHRLRISAWAANRNGGHPHAEMATQALKEMLDAAVAESVVVSHNHDSMTTIPPLPPGSRGGPNGLPNKLDCDMVLRAWCRSQHAQAGYKAEQVLEHMIQVCDTTLPQSSLWASSSQPLRPPWVAQCCPDAVTVNMVLTAHARCHAHGRVYQLWQQFSRQFPHIPLDLAVHTTVLQSLIAAASQDPWAQERAWELFEHLKGMQQQEQQQQVHGFQPSHSLPARKRKLSSTQALDEVVYQNMMELAVQQQLPERVEALFQEMKKQGQGLRPSRYCHLHRVEAWSLAGNPHQTAQALKEWIADAQDQEEHYPEPGSTTRFSLHPPKTHDWNHLLHAWIRWGFQHNNNMADGISASSDMDLMSSINADVVQHRQQALQQAEQVVRDMWNFVQTSHFWSGAPTASSYTILMGGHVKLGLPQAGQEALRLLHEMNQLHQQEQEEQQHHHSKRGSMQPTMMTYATVLSALSLSTAVDPQQAAHEMHTLLDSLCQEARGQLEQQQQQGHNAATITKRWSSAQDPATRRKELERSVNKMVNAADSPLFSMNVRQELRAKVIELQRLVLVRNDPSLSN